MSKELVKSSKTVKTINSNVRHHLDAVERARDIFVASSKRLEAEYFERIQRAAEIITGGADNSQAPEAAAPTAEAAPPS